MEVLTLPVGQLEANCYLVWDKATRDCIIIDPGDAAEFIIQKITERGLEPKKIIATHGHFDHIMATTELKLAYNIPFFMHEKDKFLVDRMRKTALHFTKVDPGPPPKADKYIKVQDKVVLNKIVFDVIEVPGHTPGSVALHSIKEDIVFVGDLIFADGNVGRTDFSYASKADLEKSVHKISKLPNLTVIYPGHGSPLQVSDLLSS